MTDSDHRCNTPLLRAGDPATRPSSGASLHAAGGMRIRLER
ncbi:hypothetical protein [Accumulibacter sp.]|nr:hypothetical protein [Accumulibacter sp.]